MEDLPIFRERLLLARRRAKLSQVQLAGRIKAFPTDISKMERGYMLPTAPRLRRLAQALDVTAGYLLGLEDETYASA